MEHSLSAYLARRTTEELRLALLSCLEEPQTEMTQLMITIIEQLLEERKSR